MMNKNILIDEYADKMPIYRQVEETAVAIIEKVIRDNKFFVMEVAHRLKSEDSLAGKVDRYIDRFQSLSDFTDLVGIRIITYFNEDIEPIAEVVLKEFEVHEIRDKRQYANAREFGYASYHSICSLKNDGKLPQECYDVRFEIQIRTVLQHAWAEIEHDLGYKSDFGIPPSLRREFSRVAGLLEIADNQFNGARLSSVNYTNMVRDAIREDKIGNLDISSMVLNTYVESGKFIRDYFSELEEKYNIDIETVDISRYIEQITWLNIKTLGEFKELFIRGRKYVDDSIDNLKKEYELDIFSSNAILSMTLEAELIRNRYSKNQLIKFYSLGYSDSNKAEKRADLILKKIEEIESSPDN